MTAPAHDHMTRLRTLEYGRFAAASLVVIDHAAYEVSFLSAGPAPAMFAGRDALGTLGVAYFFVLSGFVMLVAHGDDFGRPWATPYFWWRRIARIYPVYWLILPVPLFMFMPPHFTASDFFGVATLLSPDVSRYVNAAWTLRYEAVFYIVFGLALLPVIGRALLGLWIALLTWSLLPRAVQNLTFQPLRYWIRHIFIFNPNLLVTGLDVLFVAGLAAAACYARLRLGRVTAVVLIVAGIATLGVLAPSTDCYLRFPLGGGLAVLGLGFGAILLGLAVLEREGVVRCGRLAGWLGDVSYPLYLLHIPLLLVVTLPLRGWLRASPPGVWALLAACYALSFAGAALISWAYDRPVRRLLARLWPRR